MPIIASSSAEPRHMHYLFFVTLGIITLLTSSCGSESDRQIYRDIKGELGKTKQRFTCTDGKKLFAEFSRDRTSVLLRRTEAGEAVSLSAPAPNLTFVGDNINAIFREGRVHIEAVNAVPQTCFRD